MLDCSSDVTRGANALPELLALCWPATPADEETAFHALRAVVRCFRSAWANNVFRLALLPAARRDAQLDQLAAHAEQRDALRTLVAWVLRQHEDAFDACVALMAHSEAGLHVAAVDAMAELMQLEIAVRLNERAQVELRSQTLFEVRVASLFACWGSGLSPRRFASQSWALWRLTPRELSGQ